MVGRWKEEMTNVGRYVKTFFPIRELGGISWLEQF